MNKNSEECEYLLRKTMVNSRKDKADGENVYDDDNEITDVLLMDQDEIPNLKTEKADDVIYELTEEAQSIKINQPSATETTETPANEQIKKLQKTQEAMELKLKKNFLATEKLTRRLQKERHTKHTPATSYVALIIGGLALIIAIATVLFLVNLQQDIKSLTTSIVALENHKKNLSKTVPLNTEDLQAQVNELSKKFDMLLAGQGNLDDALQATSVLKTQLNELTDKHFSSPKNNNPVIKKSTKLKTVINIDSRQNTSEKKRHISTKPQAKKITKSSITTRSSATQKKNTLQKKAAKKITLKKNPITKTVEKKSIVKIKRDKDGSILKTLTKTTSSKPRTNNKAAIKKKTKNWVVGLGSYKSNQAAKEKASSYRKAGVPAVVVKVNAQGKIWYRVSTKSFDSKKEASTYSEQVKQKLKIKSTLVTKH